MIENLKSFTYVGSGLVYCRSPSYESVSFLMILESRTCSNILFDYDYIKQIEN